MSPERAQAKLLLRKAREDQAGAQALAREPEIADALIGFHAQQAVEKALKAVLAASGDDYPWTHDVQVLLHRLETRGVEVPAAVAEAADSLRGRSSSAMAGCSRSLSIAASPFR